MKPAIVAVGYNRPDSLKRLLNSINSACYGGQQDITLIVSLDKANNENEVLSVANESKWEYGEKIIRTFSERQGLRKHIIQCGDLSSKYDAVIILEDDLVVSPNYYIYTQAALNFYQDSRNICGIGLYSHEWNGYAYKFFYPAVDKYDTFLGQFSITWGQCWTKKWWKEFRDWYDINEDKLKHNNSIPENINNWSAQSWGKYFVNYIVERDKYYVIPRYSLSTNCSEVGQHARTHDSDHQVRLMTDIKYNYCFAPEDEAIKYDIFFERLGLEQFFPKESTDGICVDLAGYGRIDNSKRYLLSTNVLPYKIIREYALEFRPAEMNIIFGNEGKGIYLYDTWFSEKNKDYNLISVIRYEVRGIRVRFLISYVFWRILKKCFADN